MKNVFADRRAMQNPTPHVVPGVCIVNLSTNDRTVDFRPLRRPTNSHMHFNQPWAPIRTPRHEHTNSTHLKKLFADRRAMHNPTVHVVP
jgi:hypothetical protein